VLTEAAEAVTSLMRQKKHEFVVQLPDEPLFVDGDGVRLHQVFVNLLSNAAKYTDTKGHVWLMLTTRNGEALVTVRDDGIGMPPEVQRAIFEPFVQIRTSLNRSEGGLGIGLSLVRSLVELHGGRVVASSPGAGMGSEFRVWLPLSAARPVAAPDTPVPAPGSGLRILLVEDNADIREMLQLAIELDGHDVASADNGETALELLEFQQPDVAIIDIGLPDFDGYELAQIIRAHPNCADIRLLAVTGHTQASDQERALAAGFDVHLPKPVDLDELLAALVACKRSRRQS
jgi:CheY-like chemotaxis protein